MAIDVMRLLILAAQRDDIAKVSVTVADEVADYLNNKKRREMAQLEDDAKMTVQVLGAKGGIARTPALPVHRPRRPRSAVSQGQQRAVG